MPLNPTEGLTESFIERQLTKTLRIPQEKIAEARKQNLVNHLGLLTNLQKLGVITERQAVEVESAAFTTRIIKFKNYSLQPELLELIPENLRAKHQLVPLTKQGNILTVATSSLLNSQSAIPEIQKASGCFVSLVLAFPSELEERLGQLASPSANMDQMLEGKAKELNVSSTELDQKLIEDPNGPVAQVLSHIMQQAVSTGASDIHFEPMQSTLRIRFRDDGILREIKTFDRVFVAPFAAAIKVMGGMDIAETRLPQDGSISQTIAGRKIDFRVATYPTEYGEKIVMRILDSNKDWISVDSLQLPERIKEALVQTIESPQGLILCAGPTGSGKTSTLYAILKHLNKTSENILTIEDPIEYRMTGITQAQVNNKKGLTFATALRAMLRLDPNVILVGEMRDKETADTGCQAALTGHLVLSTIHANSATQTMARLIDMGVEQFIVASALRAVLSQRLLRKICTKCKVDYTPNQDELTQCGFQSPFPKTLSRGKGCSFCHNEGYKGRIPVLELLIIHNDLKPIIAKTADSGKLFHEARKYGMWTIHEDAVEKAKQGLTTTEEILRVLGRATELESQSKKAA